MTLPAALDARPTPQFPDPSDASDTAARALPPAPRVAVVQDGARLHYAIPLALQRAGALERVYVEWYTKPFSPGALVARLAAQLTPAGTRMRQRVHPELDATKILTNPLLAYRQSRARRSFPTSEDFFAWASDKMGDWVVKKGFGKANALFGFVRNVSPALCEYARRRGLTIVADQIIAPMAEERRQAAIQAERFPAWHRSGAAHNESLVEKVEARTWSAADHLTCGSEYVRETMVRAGVPAGRITVLPYPIDTDAFGFIDRSDRTTNRATVGVLGTVGLRKGTPYVLQVAERLPNVQFSLVGPVSVDRSLIAGRDNVTLVGPVPRGDIAKHLETFDVLLFPSTCEGSPSAVMEAMSTGLPVVTSFTAGTVVRHGVDGFIHAYDDVDALTASVRTLVADRDLRLVMGRAARQRAESFGLASYERGLLQVFRDVIHSLGNGR